LAAGSRSFSGFLDFDLLLLLRHLCRALPVCDGQRATVLQLPADTRAAIAERTVVERQLRESSLSI
jgi:hypothetical protein